MPVRAASRVAVAQIGRRRGRGWLGAHASSVLHHRGAEGRRAVIMRRVRRGVVCAVAVARRVLRGRSQDSLVRRHSDARRRRVRRRKGRRRVRRGKGRRRAVGPVAVRRTVGRHAVVRPVVRPVRIVSVRVEEGSFTKVVAEVAEPASGAMRSGMFMISGPMVPMMMSSRGGTRGGRGASGHL